MKVLSIDDREEDIKGIRDYCRVKNWEFKYMNFQEDLYKEIIINDPDVVVLDWFDGLDSEKDEGKKIFSSIWENGYRPIVIFSGHADVIDIDKQMQESNILNKINKGDDADITNYLEENARYFDVLSKFRKEVGKTIINSVNVISPLKKINENDLGENELKYIFAKRMVNAFDLDNLNIKLPEWGMYIYPPVSNNLQTGDIIRVVDEETQNGEMDEADKYRVIISQSCDLAHKKIDAVVCLKCKSVKDGILKCLGDQARCSVGKAGGLTKETKAGIKNAIIENHLTSTMNTGFFQQWGILPELKGVCPDMSVDLKNIELIKFDKISKTKDNLKGYQYYRVASLDTPYVSQLVWGYMQNSSRPGAPDRTVEKWLERMLK